MRRPGRTGVAALAALLAAMLAARPAPAQQTHLLLVSGLSGEPRFAESFGRWTRQIADAAARTGVPAANIRVLSESGAGTARSTRDNVLAALRATSARADTADEVVVVLFGHGSEGGAEPRINLPGPDLTVTELAAALAGLHVRRVAVVNTASASGGFVKPLSGPNRIVIAATKSGMEQNETLFGGFFAAALAGDGADTDKDGRVSLFEAFDYARREVERAYTSTGRLQTEHAVLEADGDGLGTAAPVAANGDGARAAHAFLGAPGPRVAAAPAGASGELRRLYDEKARLEKELETLRGRKDALHAADYQRQLERLLLEISRNGQAIRRLEGGAP